MDSGAFRPVNPKTAAFAILGAINWIARWYRPDGAWRAPELGAEFVSLLLNGLSTPRPTPSRRAAARAS